MRDKLKQKLYDRAMHKATEEDFIFSNVLQGNLIQFINQGVNRMTETECCSHDHISIAEKNLDAFISNMIEIGRTRRIQGSLDFTSFSITKSSLHSLWPYISN